MKKALRISNIILLVFAFLIYSCKKEKTTLPIIATTEVTEISFTTAASGGDVTNEGGASVIARGICWNTVANPTLANSKTTENGGLGAFTSNITQLTPNTLYYAKAYATNSVGTGYGNQVSFTTTQISFPVLITTGISSITQTTSISGGNITTDNGGTVTARGVCWSTGTNPTIANSKTSDGIGTGNYISNLIGLQSGTTYYVKAYSTNSAGTSYGSTISFTTQPATIPVLTTANVSSITQNTASCGGNITSDGAASITARGVCWSISAAPTIANNKSNDLTGTGAFSSLITGLAAGTQYYVRAYATNSVGTGYGSQILFTTQISSIQFNPSLTYGTVTDIEGNVYRTIVIGTQTWMAENLKSTKLNDGASINQITNASSWYYYKSQANYCWYNNDGSTYKDVYGALYNYSTINKGNICPIGWQVPTDAEWTTLTTYLGGTSIAGGKMKETGTTHWLSPNSGATNKSGFSALPGGLRLGEYFGIGGNGEWWSRLTSTGQSNICRGMSFDSNSIGNPDGTGNEFGLSIRCIKIN